MIDKTLTIKQGHITYTLTRGLGATLHSREWRLISPTEGDVRTIEINGTVFLFRVMYIKRKFLVNEISWSLIDDIGIDIDQHRQKIEKFFQFIS